MNRKLKSSLLAACTALALTGAVAHATDSDHSEGGTQAAHMHRHGHHGSALMSTLKQLDLTAEQQQSVHAVFQTSANSAKHWESGVRQIMKRSLPSCPMTPSTRR